MSAAARRQQVSEVLQSYAARGFLRGVGAHQIVNGKVQYHLRWHYDQVFVFQMDRAGKTLTFPALLRSVPARSEMYACIGEFLSTFVSGERPSHRSVNKKKARIEWSNKRGTVVLAMEVLDGDLAYATRKLINIVHEFFVVFLREGPYFDYRVKYLGLNPDADWA